MKLIWTAFKALPWYYKILLFLPFLGACLVALWFALVDRSKRVVGRDTERYKGLVDYILEENDKEAREIFEESKSLKKEGKKIDQQIDQIKNDYRDVDSEFDFARTREQLLELHRKLNRRAEEQSRGRGSGSNSRT